MSFPLTTESMNNLPEMDLHDFALSLLYRLSAYAVIHLIDDAAMLSLVFV